MVKKEDVSLIALNFLLILLVIGLFTQNYYGERVITGMATTLNISTTASIQSYFAINASTNMTNQGIVFNITTLPATNANATGNYISPPTSNLSYFYLTVEVDSNVNVDFCIKANDSLRSGANFIDLGNYTFSNSTGNNITSPSIGSSRALVSSYFLNSTRNLAINGVDYYRFWLSVPATQAAGTYVNTINFKGVQTGNACN